MLTVNLQKSSTISFGEVPFYHLFTTGDDVYIKLPPFKTYDGDFNCLNLTHMKNERVGTATVIKLVVGKMECRLAP